MAKSGKEKIINAAFYLFLKQGYQGVSLQDIKAATQLSKGAIYHHFDSKYAIYLAAVEEYFFKIFDTDFPDDAHLTLKDRLRHRYEYFAKLIDKIEYLGEGIAFPIRAFYAFQLESEKDPRILKRVQESMNNYRQEITRLVQEAKDKQEIASSLPASIIAQQLMSMVEGIAMHYSAVEKNCKIFLLEKYEAVLASYLDLIITEEVLNK